MELPDHLVPLTLFIVRVVGFVVDDDQASGAQLDPFGEIRQLQFLRGWLLAKHGAECFRLFGVLPLGPLIELLDVGEKQRPFAVRPLAFATHHTVQIPEDAQLLRNDGVNLEDSAAGKVCLKSFQHDDIRRDEQKCFGVVLSGLRVLTNRVQKLPGYDERHHLGLTGAGGHFDAVAGELIVGRQANTPEVLRVALQECLACPDLLELPDEDQALDRSLLGGVVLEGAAGGQAVVGLEPVVQEQSGGVGGAFVAARRPGGDRLADCGNTGCRAKGLLPKEVTLARRS